MDGEGDDKAKFESNVTLVQVPQLVEQGRKNCKTDFLRVYQNLKALRFQICDTFKIHLSSFKIGQADKACKLVVLLIKLAFVNLLSDFG